MGWPLRAGTAGEGEGRPQPHPPAAAGCPPSPAPPAGKPGPPCDTRPGPPAISARHLPTHSLPGTQTAGEAGAWTGRVDRQAGHASDSELMHTGLAQSSQASQHPQPSPTPAAHGESAGIGTEKGSLPTPQGGPGVYVCAHSSVSVSPRGAAAQCPPRTDGSTAVVHRVAEEYSAPRRTKCYHTDGLKKAISAREARRRPQCAIPRQRRVQKGASTDRKPRVGARVRGGGGSGC